MICGPHRLRRFAGGADTFLIRAAVLIDGTRQGGCSCTSHVEPPHTVRGVCQDGRGDACGPCNWGLRWSSLWGHDPREGYAKVGGGTHADPATGAFGGAPQWATNR
eukprot:8050531-Pyramimonas_sp.AAC.1